MQSEKQRTFTQSKKIPRVLFSACSCKKRGIILIDTQTKKKNTLVHRTNIYNDRCFLELVHTCTQRTFYWHLKLELFLKMRAWCSRTALRSSNSQLTTWRFMNQCLNDQCQSHLFPQCVGKEESLIKPPSASAIRIPDGSVPSVNIKINK